jgi:hypothetical protein|tara:strand:- start:3030 stop:3269 length:240 start_codon:yes stop_codon:yes gene_type:complete
MSIEVSVDRGNIHRVNRIKMEKKFLDGDNPQEYIDLTVFEVTSQKNIIEHEFSFFSKDKNDSLLELIGNFELSMTNEGS